VGVFAAASLYFPRAAANSSAAIHNHSTPI